MTVFVDTHTHLWNPELDSKVLGYFKGSPVQKMLRAEALIRAMDENGIDLSYVAALPYKTGLTFKEIQAINTYLEHETGRSQGRLKAYFTLNPKDQVSAQKVLDEFIDHPNFIGLKIHGPFQELYPNDENLFPIFERLEEKRKPVLFHTGGIGVKGYLDRYGDSKLFDETCTRFPNLPVILGHAGRLKYEDVAIIMRKHKNVFAEISSNFSKNTDFAAEPIKKLIETLLIWVGDLDRLIFGSDYPFYTQAYTIEILEKIEEINLAEVLKENTYRFCLENNLI